MLPLADSERQEISAAFDEAERKVKEAGAAMEALVKLLEDKCAFVSNGRIEQIRAASVPVGSSTFRLGAQRHRMLRFGAARALK